MYFTLTDQPEFSYARVRMKPKWANAKMLGTDNLSKSLAPRQVGDQRGAAVRTHLLLRAWALGRAGQAAWLAERRCRQRQYDLDIACLAQDIHKLGHGQALLGHAHANGLLSTWLPDLTAIMIRGDR